MPYVKEPIVLRGTVIAREGRWVSQAAVDKYGWHDKVAPDAGAVPDPDTVIEIPLPEPEPGPEQQPQPAPEPEQQPTPEPEPAPQPAGRRRGRKER